MDAQKTNTTAKDADGNMVPDSALPTGKNAINVEGKAILLSSAIAKQAPMLPASDLAKRNKYQNPRKSFMKQLQTQAVAKQTSQTMTLTRLQCKLTL